MAGLWDDLSPQNGAGIYYYNDAVNNRFIVQFDSVPHFYTTTGLYTFEMILYSNGDIVYQYQSVSGAVNNCTIGIENGTGLVGLQVVYNAAYLVNNLAIRFSARPIWLSLGTPSSGTLNAGECAYLKLNFNAANLAQGSYNGSLIFASDDPDENPTTVPVTFLVGQLNPPTNLVMQYLPGTNQLQFNWVGSGAPQYKLYSSTSSDGPFTTLEGTTTGTTLTITSSASAILYYVVVASF